MKIVITGASGLLGRAIKKELDKVETWEIIGLGFNRLKGGLKKVDICNNKEITAVITDLKPDVVIHSAAERRPDHVKNKEKETEKLNVTATETIAKAANTYGGFVLYISTDYVFDGTSPPYKVDDQPNPLNKYGLTKLQGEICTRKNCPSSGVLRVPILYGETEFVKESAVTGLLPILQDSKTEASVSNYEQRYPTSTSDVAVVCRQIIEYRQNNPSFCGVWQWRSNDKLTKYEMVKIMADVFNLPIGHIKAANEPSPGAPRPYDCEFDCSELENVSIGRRTPFKIAIKSCLQPYLS